jgi:hypothetical protein
VTTGHFAEEIAYEVLSITQVGAAALSALSLVWWVETPRIEWHPLVIWTVLITGLLCTAVAFTIQAWAQRFTTNTTHHSYYYISIYTYHRPQTTCLYTWSCIFASTPSQHSQVDHSLHGKTTPDLHSHDAIIAV